MSEYQLTGLRADNPLGFLAAVGTLRTAAGAYGAQAVRMRWAVNNGAWSPLLRIGPVGSEGEASEQGATRPRAELVDRLDLILKGSTGRSAFDIGDDLTLSPAALRSVSQKAAFEALPQARDFADFIAAFGCDAVEAIENGKPSGRMADTAFRTMSGAGHQHFLGFMRTLTEDCTAAHLLRALFSPWRYDDPQESHTLRWDPMDDVRYALRWRDSSGDPERKRGGAMWGANRLAIEALPMFPTLPIERNELATTGFSSSRKEGTHWTWPVWTGWCSLDVVRSMLALQQLQAHHPPRTQLARMGIAEVFRCQRIRQGKYRNLTPALSV